MPKSHLRNKGSTMFHLHILGTQTEGWLAGYDESKDSNDAMGKWFLKYRRDVQIYLLFVNHPVHPV